jgi:ribonuclease HI
MAGEGITIYADGACSGNPGPGGWAAAILHRGATRELSGGFAKTTNNRMELYSVIAALTAIGDLEDAATVYSDSRYVVDMIREGNAERWRQNGWMRDRKHLAQNSDLWERLLTLCQERDIEFVWVKGHDGHAENERVDQLAVEACGGKDLPVDEGFVNPPLFPSDGLFG